MPTLSDSDPKIKNKNKIELKGSKLNRVKKRKQNKSALAKSTIAEQKASFYFFSGIIFIIFLGLLLSNGPKQGIHGILFAALGTLIVILPPQYKVPKWIVGGAVLFILGCSLSLLPKNWVKSQSWRTELELLGLDTGNLISPHPAQTFQSILLITSIIIVGLTFYGHKLTRNDLCKVMFWFCIALGSYVGISILFYKFKIQWMWNNHQTFGFFPNPNHTGTLVALASVSNLGTMVLLIIKKKNIQAFICSGTLIIILWASLHYTNSKASWFMIFIVNSIWFISLGKKHRSFKMIISFTLLIILTFLVFLSSNSKTKREITSFLQLKPKAYNSESSKINYEKNEKYALKIKSNIYRDTISMIANEPWTGTGLTTFEYIFPQYRKMFINDRHTLHPESNWLDLLSEGGWLSAITLLLLILLLFFKTIVFNLHSRSRIIIASCLCASGCIFVNSFFDVPAQKITIILSGMMLLAITYKPQHDSQKISHFNKLIFCCLGMSIFLGGLWLIASEWITKKPTPVANVVKTLESVNRNINESHHFEGIDKMKSFNSTIAKLEKSSSLTPLDPTLHFVHGKILTQLSGTDSTVKELFKIESFLDPIWSYLPIRQANCWIYIDPDETIKLWFDGLLRAERIDSNSPMKSNFSISLWKNILDQSKLHPVLLNQVSQIALEKKNPDYLEMWMEIAGDKNLAKQMPLIMNDKNLPEKTKLQLIDSWIRISPETAKIYTPNK